MMRGMATDAEVFLEKLRALFGKESSVKRIEPTRPDQPPLALFIYRNIPEPGWMTAVTYGLSLTSHPAWTQGSPELTITLETDDEVWALAIAYFAARFGGELDFSVGSIFTLDEPISPESGMSAFLAFAPSSVTKADATLKLPSKTVHLVGMYPLYAGEVDLIARGGLKPFWHHPKYDVFSVCRPDLSKLGAV
jgi:hypothetical protein